MRWSTDSLLLIGLLGTSAGSAAPPAERPAPPANALVARVWDPGFMPTPWWGRTTLTLTTTREGAATLELTVEKPPDNQRRQFNPSGWRAEPSRAARLTGTATPRGKAGTTYWFEVGSDVKVALVCAPSSEPVHGPQATLDWGACTPCYDDCKANPTWTPPRARLQRGLSCQLFRADQVDAAGAPLGSAERSLVPIPGLPSPPERPLFFSSGPPVELVIGKGDCPPMGLRESEPAATGASKP